MSLPSVPWHDTLTHDKTYQISLFVLTHWKQPKASKVAKGLGTSWHTRLHPFVLIRFFPTLWLPRLHRNSPLCNDTFLPNIPNTVWASQFPGNTWTTAHHRLDYHSNYLNRRHTPAVKIIYELKQHLREPAGIVQPAVTNMKPQNKA